MAFGKVQVQIASNGVVRCIQTLDYSTGSEKMETYSRTGVYVNDAWDWGDWQELVTKNKIKQDSIAVVFSDGVYTLNHNLGVKPYNISLTPQFDDVILRYDWDNSDENNAIIYATYLNGTPVSVITRFSYLIII